LQSRKESGSIFLESLNVDTIFFAKSANISIPHCGFYQMFLTIMLQRRSK